MWEPQEEEVVHGLKPAVPEMEKGYSWWTLALRDARELNPLWVLQRGLGGASTPRYHGKKSGCLLFILFYIQAIYLSIFSSCSLLVCLRLEFALGSLLQFGLAFA